MLLLNACTNTNNQVSNASRFSSNQVLTPTITYIDGCSKQLDLVLLDKFYVVQNDVEGGQNNYLCMKEVRIVISMLLQ